MKNLGPEVSRMTDYVSGPARRELCGFFNSSGQPQTLPKKSKSCLVLGILKLIDTFM